MRSTSILGNSQKLDGGAMFGNAPRQVWSRWLTPDDENRIELACRAWLIEFENRKILVETGIGVSFDPDLAKRFGVDPSRDALVENLAKNNIRPENIDLVILSHLHFDHAGGLIQPGRKSLTFPNAEVLVGRTAWERALYPHPRDRASFIPELATLLLDSGRLTIVDTEWPFDWGKNEFRFSLTDGHTPGQLHLAARGASGAWMTFAGDLIPGTAWLHLPITMGYDRAPEQLIDEKKAFYEGLGEGWVFFTHDPQFSCAQVEFVNGKYVAKNPQAEIKQWSW